MFFFKDRMEFLYNQGLQPILMTQLLMTPTSAAKTDQLGSKARKSSVSAAKGWTPLIRAILTKRSSTQIIALVNNTPTKDIDHLDHKGRTALYFAVRDEDSPEPVLEALLRKGANPALGCCCRNAVNSPPPFRYPSPFVVALSSGDFERVDAMTRAIESRVANRRLMESDLYTRLEPHGSINLLNLLVATGNIAACRWLIEVLGDEYVVASAGELVPTVFNALDTALLQGRFVIADLLVDALRRQNALSDLPFVRSNETGETDVPVEREGSTVLHRLATADRNAQAMDYCLHRLGFDPNKTRSDGYTPLHAAVASGASEIILTLLRTGANKNLTAIVNPKKPPLTPHRFAQKKIRHGHLPRVRTPIIRLLKP